MQQSFFGVYCQYYKLLQFWKIYAKGFGKEVIKYTFNATNWKEFCKENEQEIF